MSVIVLAGGKSQRMGSDKAFLQLGQRSFISILVEEMLSVSDDLIVVIGTKSPKRFTKEIKDERVRFANDWNYLENPLGGMLTGFRISNSEYAAVVACDSPLVRKGLLRCLFSAARGHDAAVPIWDTEHKLSMEPLCAVYNVSSMKKEIDNSLRKGVSGCKHVVLSLQDVNYVPVSDLRQYDPCLISLRNINTKSDYEELLQELAVPNIISARRTDVQAKREVPTRYGPQILTAGS
ncbi:MAG: molybdenum cofactor guanylyltransferase [Nitrososphaerota archaeon]|nr:molybdenum cofactor guanylyltransferase [Nitrososphaerota archaeon]